MFGCQAIYFNGALCLVIAKRTEPWNGLLICTDRSCHDSLKSEFPDLVQHPTLKKWLYLSANQEYFEEIAQNILGKVKRGDTRIRVEPR